MYFTRSALVLATLLLKLAPTRNDGRQKVSRAATSTGATPCNACKNCKYCKHCSKNGGKCGVCSRRATSAEKWRQAAERISTVHASH
jgi:hypothetical protein